MCDLLYFLDGVTAVSYADNATLYSVNKTKYLVIKKSNTFPNSLFNGLTLTTYYENQSWQKS